MKANYIMLKASSCKSVRTAKYDASEYRIRTGCTELLQFLELAQPTSSSASHTLASLLPALLCFGPETKLKKCIVTEVIKQNIYIILGKNI